MKYFIISFAIISSINLFSQEDGIARYLDKYIQEDEFEHTYVSNRMFSAILKNDASDLTPGVKESLKAIKGMRQLYSKKDGKKHFDAFTQIFESKGYENVLFVKKTNDRISMYLKNENKSDAELIMIMQQNNLIQITGFYGQISLEKMAQLSKELNIEGAEYIPQAKKK